MDNFDFKKYLAEGRIHLKEGMFGNVIQSLTQDISKAQDEGDSKMVSILKSYLPKLKTSEGDAEIESTLNALDTELAREFGESFDIVGSYLAEGRLLKEVRGPIEKIELHIKKGESVNDLDQYGFETNVDDEPIEDLFDKNGLSLRDMSIIYDQRGDMYLMDTEDITKYH